ncbi:MAG: hypothetical protein ACRCXE_00215 [Metamycoplasmataceae bacterium]
MSSGSSILEISLFVVFGIMILVIIIALIWTKVIKRNDFSFISYEYFHTPSGKKMFLNLINKGTLKKIHTRVVFRVPDLTIQAINSLFIGNNNIYLISKSIARNVEQIKYESNSFYTVSNKNDKLKINPEIELFLNGSRNFKKHFELQDNTQVIVPIANKEFKTTRIQNITFVSISNLDQIITQFELDENSFISAQQIEEVEKTITKKSNRLFVKFKNTYE